jgi:predicted nucleotidyltransferase
VKTTGVEALREIVERLAAEFEPEEIYVFGSRAWGEPTEGSDLDLLIIVSDSDREPTERATRAYRCLRGVMESVDVLVKTRGEVNRYRGVRASLLHRILEQGKRVYGRGEALTGT